MSPETMIYLAIFAGPLGLALLFVAAPICYFDKNKKDKYLPAKLALAAVVLLLLSPMSFWAGISSQQAVAKSPFDAYETIPS